MCFIKHLHTFTSTFIWGDDGIWKAWGGIIFTRLSKFNICSFSILLQTIWCAVRYYCENGYESGCKVPRVCIMIVCICEQKCYSVGKKKNSIDETCNIQIYGSFSRSLFFLLKKHIHICVYDG